MAEANKTTNGNKNSDNKNSDNSAMQQTEENDQKRVHWSRMQLQRYQVYTHAQLH